MGTENAQCRIWSWMDQGRRKLCLRQYHCGIPHPIPKTTQEFHKVCLQCTTQVHRALPGVWGSLSSLIWSLGWPQHGLPQKNRIRFLGTATVLMLVKAHPLEHCGWCFSGHVPAHGSTQGFGNVKCKGSQRELIAPMYTAVMGSRAGGPAQLSRDLKVPTATYKMHQMSESWAK